MPERFFYGLGAMAALGTQPPRAVAESEVVEDLIRIWDEQKYTPADAVDFAAMADSIKPHLTKYAVKDPLHNLRKHRSILRSCPQISHEAAQ